MAATPSVAILRDIQTLFDVGTASGMTDRQLLERFANRRDDSADAAFEVLILRHGPMVLRVCRNMLRDEADVADAFQATFLVLVRRRETLRDARIRGWLALRRGLPGRGTWRELMRSGDRRPNSEPRCESSRPSVPWKKLR